MFDLCMAQTLVNSTHGQRDEKTRPSPRTGAMNNEADQISLYLHEYLTHISPSPKINTLTLKMTQSTINVLFHYKNDETMNGSFFKTKPLSP